MALTADVFYETSVRDLESTPAANTVQIFAGALVAINAAGFATNWGDVVGNTFAGLNSRDVTGDTAAADPPEANVNVSGIHLKKVTVATTASQADNGALVHATDEDTLTLVAGANVNAIGQITRYYQGTICDVRLFNPAEYLGL